MVILYGPRSFSLEFFSKQLIDNFRISFAFSGLHDLPHKPAEDFFFSVLVFFYFVEISREDLVDYIFSR